MQLEPIWIAILGLAASIGTAIPGVLVAWFNWKSGTRKTAETTMENTLRERILLKDEKNADCMEELKEKEHENEVLRETVEEQRLLIRELRRELESRKDS